MNKLEANDDWEELDDMNIHYSSEDVKLCFVYQSDEMARLYRKYGVNLILLDATQNLQVYYPIVFVGGTNELQLSGGGNHHC